MEREQIASISKAEERKWQLIFPFAKWFFIEIGKERSLWQGYHQPNWAEMAVLEVYFVVMQNSVPWSLWSIGHILQRKNFFLPFLKIFLKKFSFSSFRTLFLLRVWHNVCIDNTVSTLTQDYTWVVCLFTLFWYVCMIHECPLIELFIK